jgi:hypothetical protein
MGPKWFMQTRWFHGMQAWDAQKARPEPEDVNQLTLEL